MAILDAINKQLEEIKVSKEERRSVARPLVRMVGVDLYNIYTHVLDRYIQFRYQEVLKKQNRSPEEQSLLNETVRREAEWRGRALGRGPYYKFETYDLVEELENASPLKMLEGKDHAAAEKFKRELIELFVGCEKKGGFTVQYAEYYDRYHEIAGYDRKIIDLFDFNPSEVK